MNSTDLDQMLNNIIIEVNSIISAIQSYNQKEINDAVTDRKHLELFEFLTDLEHIFKTSKRILKFVLSNKYKSINDDTNDTTNNSGGGGVT